MRTPSGFLKILSAFLLIGLGFFPAFTVFDFNGSGTGFCDGATMMAVSGCEGDRLNMGLRSQSRAGAWNIESLVEEGAGYSLEALSGYLMLLNRVEMANLKGLDYPEMLSLAEAVREKLAQAAAVYDLLAAVSLNTPYNNTVRAQLKTLDYSAIQSRYSLNPNIFREVKEYLVEGNIRGLYIKAYETMSENEGKLISVCEALEQKKLPSLHLLWEISDSLSNKLVFGQYVSRIFYEIKGFEVPANLK